MTKNKLAILALVTTAIVLSASFTVLSFTRELAQTRLPILGQVHNFELIDAEGRSFELKQLTGKVWIADFIFTTCSDICPMMTKNMAALSRSFEGVKDVRLVSVTVNPEFDTAPILRKYAKDHGAGSQWIFLTGDRQTITDLAVKSFKFGHKEEPVFHSSYFGLVDRHGMIRGYYDGTNKEDVNRLFKETAALLKE